MKILIQNNLFWAIFSLLIVFLFFTVIFFLQKKQKKIEKQIRQRQNEWAALQKTLKTLTENQEEMVQNRITSLQKEVEMLKENLQVMRKTLSESKAAAKRNSLLMTKISNSLRTNLNDILGFSTLLGNEFALREETELFDYNENIRKSGEALVHLLNNIIDISKIDSHSFYLHETECDLTEITEDVINRFKPAAEQKGLQIVFQKEKIPHFSADKQAVNHILTNLLDNAIKYTEKGFIKISETFNEKYLVWTIKDTGIGIDKAYLPDIFEPFRQQSLGYTKTTYQGAGLGLPLIKSMLEIMGGSVEIESEKAVGTTVRVFFPFKEWKKTTASAPDSQKKTNNVKKTKEPLLQVPVNRVMVWDEDKLECMLIKKILSGVEVVSFDALLPPIKWVEKTLESGFLPDVFMIELDFSGKEKGPVLYNQMRKKYPEIDTIPAIALSAYPDRSKKEEILKQGFDVVLQKPFRKNEVFSALNKLNIS